MSGAAFGNGSSSSGSEMVEDKSGGVHRACDSKGLRANQLFGRLLPAVQFVFKERIKVCFANKKGRKCFV